MGKFMRTRRGIDDVAVMEVSSSQVGVRTRARTLALAESSSANVAKRTKLEVSLNSAQFQLTSRRQVVITPEKSTSSENSGQVISDSRCSDHLLVSRCSSNGSSELLNQSLRSVVDLEDSHEFENSPYRERTPSSELRSPSNNLESAGRSTEMDSHHKSTDEEEKMPTESEIEDFFSEAEKAEEKRFAERYNYDVVKDVPLEGRYEWIQLKP